MAVRLSIGIAGPLTGPRAAYGALLRAAVDRAEPWFEPVLADDRAEVAQAETVARAFIANGVDAVVGHFNSDCARAAGALYRQAGVPFLMPASTADDLTGTTDGIRICAADTMQIDALAEWLSEQGTRITEIWEDGSPYAARLGSAIRARGLFDDTNTSGAPIALLGAHHAVAREMQARGSVAGAVFVPDDCAIAEFAELLDGVEATVLCPQAQPDFAECVAIALSLLRDAAHQSQSPSRQLQQILDQHPSLRSRQYTKAGFLLQRSTYQKKSARRTGS